MITGTKEVRTRRIAVVTRTTTGRLSARERLDHQPGRAASPKIVGVVSLYMPQDRSTTPLCVRVLDGAPTSEARPTGRRRDRHPEGDPPVARRLHGGVRTTGLAAVQGSLPYKGFGWEAIIQSTVYSNSLDTPQMATALDVIDQNVPENGDRPSGAMPVAFALQNGASRGILMAVASRACMTASWISSRRGLPIYDDRRVLSATSLPGPALGLRVAPGVVVNGQPRDVAVVLDSKGNSPHSGVRRDQSRAEPAPLLGACPWPRWGREEGARAFDVEGTLAYLSVGGEIAVIDFSTRGRIPSRGSPGSQRCRRAPRAWLARRRPPRSPP